MIGCQCFYCSSAAVKKRSESDFTDIINLWCGLCYCFIFIMIL